VPLLLAEERNVMPSPLSKSTLPICSTQRAIELGMDPAQTSTCAPHENRKTAGCPVWDSCRFHRKEYGGFKGTRPHFLGIFMRDIEGGAKRDQCACFTFVSAYQPIMDFGLMMRQTGRPNYPVVKIIGQEGDKIKVWRFPQTVGKDGQLHTTRVAKEVVIPQFPDPTEVDENMEFEREAIEEYDADVLAETVHVPEADPS
jgi:hypothetical protein